MSTPDDPYASPSGDQPDSGRPEPSAQPGQQPNQPSPGYAPGYGPSPGYGAAPGQPGQPAYGQPAYGQPQYGQPAWGQPGGYPQPKRTNGLAIAALVCSLAAFLVCVSAPVGVVLGFVALSQIKRTGEDGRGLALAGIWVGGIVTALAVIGLTALVVFGVWLADDLDDNCPRDNFVSEQDYQDCVDRQLNDRFNTESGSNDTTPTSFTTTSLR